jgi:Family of unknown function (DUF5336)
MTYSTGGPGYPPPQQPNPYGSPPPTPTTQFAKTEEGPGNWPMILLGVVIALSLIGYLVSFFPNVANDNLVRVALVLAGLLATVDLLPKQRDYTAVVSVIASIGFLLAISNIYNGSSGWAWIAIIVLTGLQALAAVGALLLEAGVITVPAPRPKYEQYPPYGAPGQYYGQPPQQTYTQPPAYPGYGGYPGAPAAVYPPPPQAGPPTPPTGFPTYGQPPTPTPAPAPGPEDNQPQPQDSSAQSGPPPA